MTPVPNASDFPMVIAVVSAKGGSAKTTSTVALAEACAARDLITVVIDCDPQAAATRWLGVTPDADAPGLLDALTGATGLETLMRQSSMANCAVIAASDALLGAERVLAREVAPETLLRERIRACPLPVDIWLIDTAPGLHLLSLGALVAATDAVIPVELRGPGLPGVTQALDAITAVQRRLNPDLARVRIVPCRLDGRAKHTADVLAAVRATWPQETTTTVIPEAVACSVAACEAVPLARHAPRGAAALAYAALVDELLAPREKT